MDNSSNLPTNGQPPTAVAEGRAELLADLARIIEEKEKECSALREEVARLSEKCQRLSANAGLWECEWDAEQRVLRPHFPPSFPVVTPEEIEDLRQNGVELKETLAYLDSLEGQ